MVWGIINRLGKEIKYEKNLTDLNIQLFAEDVAKVEETFNKDEILTFDEILKDKTYQSEFDKKVSKAIETAKANEKAEKEIAEFIKNKFGGKIFMYPRVNVPEGIRTPDYLLNGEKWDLKDIIKYNEKTIDNAIRKSKGQSANVILNIINSDYTDEILNNIMNRIYGSKDRQFLNKTIIIKDNKIYKILKRK